MSPTTEDKVTSLANNVYLLLVSRFMMAMMPLATTGLIWFSGFYLDSRFRSAAVDTAHLAERVSTLERRQETSGQNLSKLETAQQLTAQQVDEMKAAQTSAANTVATRLDRIEASIFALANSVSGLTAEIRANK